MPNLLKVRVSLKGRPVRSYTFNKQLVTIGRDPGSDIYLDNTGISRNHARIERTPAGYVAEDLGSANGIFLNEKRIQRDYVGHDDVVRIGKFALWLGVEADRREDRPLGEAAPETLEGTTVLSPDQLLAMQESSRQKELSGVEPSPHADRRPAGLPASTVIVLVGTAFLLGVFAGAAGTLLTSG